MRPCISCSVFGFLALFFSPGKDLPALETFFSGEFALENGDANGDGERDLTDAVYTFHFLFRGGPAPVPLAWCAEGEPLVRNGDTNGDGEVDVSDGVHLLAWRYLGGAEPAPACGLAEGSGGGFPAAPKVIPPHARAFGRTFVEWSAAWWQWIFSIPVDQNPILDLTGAVCHEGQSGKVFFLAGAGTTDPVTRACTVRLGTPLFFPLINAECSTVEPPPFFGGNAAELSDCAGSFFSSGDALSCAIDGVALQELERFRAQSPVFDFSMPAEKNLLGLPGVTSGMSVSDGYWLLLAPLRR